MNEYLALILWGAFAWTFVEYALHNWVFHRLRVTSVGKREHLAHHAKKGYFTEWSLKLKMVFVGHSAVYLFSFLCLDAWRASVFTLSFGVSYFAYEYVHYCNHMYAPKTIYGRWARKHHFAHHFEDSRANHGVTTPLWDLIFGTYRRIAKVRVPKRFEMDWLVDDKGRVRQAYRDDYALR